MPECKKIRTKKRQLCTGDLQHEIKLNDRTISRDNDGNVDYVLTFENELFAWAAIDTLAKGLDIFNGANRRARVVTVQDKQCACFILRSYTNDRNIPQREIEGESPTSVWWNKAHLDTRRHWERTRPLVDVRS